MDQKLVLDIHHAWGSLRKNGSYPPFFPAAQPVSLERRHLRKLRHRNYFVSEKTDGIRMGFICKGDTAAFVNRRLEMKPVNFDIPKEMYKGTMLDGEMLVDGTYVVYDAVIIRGVCIKDYNFNERLYYMRKLLTNLPFSIKKFYFVNNIKYLLNNLSSRASDGLIFTPWDEPVRVATNKNMFKWKPLKDITIDFRIDGGKLYIQDRNSPVYVTATSWASDYPDDTIIECSFVNGEWTPLKIRTDKDYPNSTRTFDSTMKSIKENVTIQDILRILSRA